MERTRDGVPPTEHRRSHGRLAFASLLPVTTRYGRPDSSRGFNAYPGSHSDGAVSKPGLFIPLRDASFGLGRLMFSGASKDAIGITF